MERINKNLMNCKKELRNEIKTCFAKLDLTVEALKLVYYMNLCKKQKMVGIYEENSSLDEHNIFITRNTRSSSAFCFEETHFACISRSVFQDKI